MVQNAADVFVAPQQGRLARSLTRSRVLLVALLPVLLCLCAVGAATRETQGAAVPPEGSARLLELQREAVDLLKQAGRSGVPHASGPKSPPVNGFSSIRTSQFPESSRSTASTP